MFEYWIYHNEDFALPLRLEEDLYSRKSEEASENNGDRIWLFKAKNLFVIQSNIPFGDGNLVLDDLLIKLAKNYEIHDKGIIKSCRDASSFH
ncbi:hypothetical protein [Fictibacillus halophilus]|uniref:hypothetical protein n=1 Tax=Fictibacillus halophilus TaxID=1610490 RepID=UPI001CFA9847|nr:hypothetical protein [Fictibacillus halophilus]